MADDQVKYSDLISDDVAKGIAMLDEALKGLRDTMASLKDTAINIGESIKGMGTVTKEQQQVTAKEAAEIEALNKKVKDLTDKIKKLEDVKLHYRKLTDDQITSLKAFQAALQGSSKQVLDAVNAIEIEKKSYNELNAIYNTLKDSLNAMTIAERQNSEAGKAMTAQAAKIYDTMNELQKATGKYTLQVGKYRAAFDGLGYSIQQVIREVPSALNLNQFFLAISNNIPLVVDQLKAFQDEQKEIKANLDQMTKGTKEYAEQQAKLISLGKKVGKSILSWQTAIIAVLFVLRQINFDKIWKGIKNLIGLTKDWWSETKAVRQELNSVANAVKSAVEPARVELQFLLNDLKDAKYGTQEYEYILYRIEEIIGKTVNHTKDQKEAVEEVTKAYIEQLKQVETNKAVVERFGALNKRKYALENIFNPMQDDSLLGWITGLSNSDKEDVEEALAEYRKFMDDVTKENYEVTDVISGMYDSLIKKYGKDKKESINEVITKRLLEKVNGGDFGSKEIIESLGGWGKNEEANLHYIIKSILEKDGDIKEGVKIVARELVRTKKTIEQTDSMFNDLYSAIPTNFVDGGGTKGNSRGSFSNSYKPVTMADIAEAEAKGMKDKGDNALAEIQLWYDKRTAIANAAYKKDIETLKKERNDRKKSLRENLNEANVFISSYNGIVANLDKEHAAGRLKDNEWKAQKAKLREQFQEAIALRRIAGTEGERIDEYYDNMEAAALLAKENELADIEKTAAKKRNAERVKTHETELKTRWDVFNQEVHTEREKAEEEKKIAIDLAEFKLKVAEESGFYTVEEIAEMRENLKKLRAELENIGFKYDDKEFKTRQDADKRRFDLEKHNAIERAKFNMEQEIASKQWQIDHAKELKLSEAELAILKEEVEWLQKKYNQGNYNAKRGDTGNYSNIMDVLFGEKITNDQVSAINSVFDQAKAALNSWMDARKAAADQAKQLADDEVSAAENALNREIELRNQGYANDVALREKELAKAKENQKKSIEQQQKYKEQELAINTAMEASNMAVAVANIFKQFTFPYNVLMAAAMVGAWGAAKISALNQVRTTKYREGGVMLLEGGSHESGHDVNLGIGPDGSNLRAEGGEYFAVINKRSSRKYGSQIPAVVNALNSGMFEDRYIKTSDAVGLLPQVIRADNGTAVDLSSLEGGVDALVKQGESRWSTEGEWRVMRYKNLTRRVRIS